MTMVSRLEREGAIIELGKKANREGCCVNCFSVLYVLNVDAEDLIYLGAEAGVEWWRNER